MPEPSTRIAWFQAAPETLAARCIPPGNTVLAATIMPGGNIAVVFEGIDVPMPLDGQVVPQMVLLFGGGDDFMGSWFVPIETAPGDAEAAAEGIRRATDRKDRDNAGS